MPTLTPRVLAALDPSKDLNDRERAILRETRANSLSGAAIAERIGLGGNPGLVTPILDRLESLDLIQGFYASGRASTHATERPKRYYRLSERGRSVTNETP